jgi:hypothetical protein
VDLGARIGPRHPAHQVRGARFEIGTSAMSNSQGVLVASGANLGLSFD